MKLDSLILPLVILGIGLGTAPAQGDNGRFMVSDQWSFMKVKGGDDRRWKREDDDHDDDDDDHRRGRDKRGEREFRGGEAAYGNTRQTTTPPPIPRNRQLNFKERRYLELQQQREAEREAMRQNR